MRTVPILSKIVSRTLLKSFDRYCFKPNRLNESSMNVFSILQKKIFPFKLQNQDIQLSSTADDSSSSSLPFSSEADEPEWLTKSTTSAFSFELIYRNAYQPFFPRSAKKARFATSWCFVSSSISKKYMNYLNRESQVT